MTRVHISRAAFPILPTVPVLKNIQYTHRYSASDKTSFYDMENAVTDFSAGGWFDMASVDVLEANGNSLTEWNVSGVGVSTQNNTYQSTTIPPEVNDERYIASFTLSAQNYDGSDVVSYTYEGSSYVPYRAISLLNVEGMTYYEYRKLSSTQTNVTLYAYLSESGLPEYTRQEIYAYRTSWLVEVWTQIDGVWYMDTETVVLISTVTGTSYFCKAARLNAWDKQGIKSKDDITETEVST